MRISDWSSDVCSSDLDVHSELVGSIFWRLPLNNVKQICMLLLPVAGQLGAALHELMQSLQDREVTTALVVFAILLPPSLAALGRPGSAYDLLGSPCKLGSGKFCAALTHEP